MATCIPPKNGSYSASAIKRWKTQISAASSEALRCRLHRHRGGHRRPASSSLPAAWPRRRLRAEAALLAWTSRRSHCHPRRCTFAELGGLYHRSGGQYEILRDSYGPVPAFLSVFCNATAIQSGAIAIIAVICMKNLARCRRRVAADTALPSFWGDSSDRAADCRPISSRRSLGATIQNITVVAKVAALIVVTLLAAFSAARPAVIG